MTIVELSLITALAIHNTPYERKQITVWPELRVENSLGSGFFFGVAGSARCNPKRLNQFDPDTAKWTVEAGWERGDFRMSVGHTSEHGIDRIVPATESLDFAKLTWRSGS